MKTPYKFESRPTGYVGVTLAKSKRDVEAEFFAKEPDETSLEVQAVSWPEYVNTMRFLRDHKDHAKHWDENA